MVNLLLACDYHTSTIFKLQAVCADDVICLRQGGTVDFSPGCSVFSVVFLSLFYCDDFLKSKNSGSL